MSKEANYNSTAINLTLCLPNTVYFVHDISSLLAKSINYLSCELAIIHMMLILKKLETIVQQNNSTTLHQTEP